MTCRIALAVAACALPAATVSAAQPTNASTAALFAGGNLTVGGSSVVTGGPVVANGGVFHGGGSWTVPSLYGGAGFNAGGGGVSSGGEVLFNGTIQNYGGLATTTAGNISSAAGNVLLAGSTTVNGTVTALGNVSQPSGVVNGNVRGNGNVSIGGTVNGNVTYGGTYTPGAFATVTGTVMPGAVAPPVAFSPLALPAGSNLTPGVGDITLATFETRNLAPGAYGNLTFATGNTVNLTAGTYVFAGVYNAFSLNRLNFDTSAGAIKLYVAGDYEFNLSETVNGLAVNAASLADLPKVSFEVGGNFYGDADVFGTVFAPSGNVTLNTFADVTGRVLGGRDVILLGSNNISVPEPAALAALAAGGVSLLARRRRAAL